MVEGSIGLPVGGSITLSSCTGSGHSNGGDAEELATISVNGTSLAMTISRKGAVLEHIDRHLTQILSVTNSSSGSGGASLNFTLLQRHGMYEFYLADFLALPERLPSVESCMDLVVGGELKLGRVWNMTAMPPAVPVKPAPTFPHPTPAPPPTPGVVCRVHEFMGCMNETNCGPDVSARCVNKYMQNDGALSRERCAKVCHDKGFKIAGVELGSCFCADVLNSPSCGRSAVCDHKCSGNSSESCGGYCAVDVFTFDCAPTVPTA